MVPDLPEALTEGRERTYLEWFYRSFAHQADAITPADIDEYLRTYARPGALGASFGYYRSIPDNVAANQALKGSGFQLTMPVLAVGGACTEARGRASEPAASLREIADDVTEAVVDGSGHFVPEEQPARIRVHAVRLSRASSASDLSQRGPPASPATGSAVKLLREVDEVVGDDVPLIVRAEVGRLAGPVFGGSHDECRAHAAAAGSAQIVVVRGNHHGFGRLKPEHRDRGVVHLGARLVLPGHFRAERCIPRKPGVACHVDDQCDMAVRKRGQQKPRPEPVHSLPGVRPAVEPVPDAIEVACLLVAQATQPEARQQRVENLAMEDIRRA